MIIPRPRPVHPLPPLAAATNAARRAASLLMAMLCVTGLSAVLAHAQAESWPTLQGGPGHTGDASGAVAPPLKRSWRTDLPIRVPLASVAVVPGLAVAVGQTAVVGLDPADGHVLWTADDRKRGPLTTAAIDPGLGSSGVIVFTEGDRRGTSALVGMDLTTRQRLWSLPLGDLVQGSPTLDGGHVYAGARDGVVYAADAATGRLLWKAKTAASVTSTPAVSDGRVFVVNQDDRTGNVQLIALDATSGRSRWIYAQPRAAQGQPSSATVSGGRVYVGFGDLTVRAFDVSTGALVWTTAMRSSFSPRSCLAVVGGDVYALDVIGGLYRLDASSGDRIWDYQFPAFVSWSSPVVAGAYVYVAMDDGTVAAVDVDRGHLVWQANGGGEIGALAPAGDLLLAPVASGAGGILGFAHDPAGALLDQPSPTELDLTSSLASFGGAFLIITALLLGLFRFVLRSRDERDSTDGPASTDGRASTDGSLGAGPEGG